ncbi:SPOR domain-containing protein [Rossellomorea sp. BNER]|uniref:SPOR domain-containing protein n=1 Tax=Rossellomorea sp. BNER TaxID=2962031 RepID=UPI003AF1EF56|nr:SPOR domain-containing protein [Rossellomorea sp. BNER]
MDKQSKNGGKITVKINGEKTKYQEDLLVHDWQLGTDELAAAKDRAEDDSFDWVLPDEETKSPKEYKKINYVQEKGKKKKKSFKGGARDYTIFLYPLIGAVAIGITLGFIILNVITEGEQSTPAIALQEEVSSKGEESGETSGSSKKIQAFSLPVLQAGVFATEESANEMQSSIESKGVPAAMISSNEQYYLFVGIGENLDTVKSFGKKLKEKNIEVYAKEFTLPEKQIKVTANEADFINKGMNIFTTLAQESITAGLENKVNESVVTSIEKQQSELDGLKIKNKTLVSMKEDLTSAFKSIKEYSSTADDAHLQKARESLLSFVEKYNKL